MWSEAFFGKLSLSIVFAKDKRMRGFFQEHHKKSEREGARRPGMVYQQRKYYLAL